MIEPEHSDHNDEPSPKYQDWPVSKSDTRPVKRGAVGSKPAFTVLRIVLWLLPAIVVPVVVFCSNLLAMQLKAYMLSNLLCWVFSLAAVAALGYFDQRIALQQKGLELAHGNNKITRRVVIFVICQIFIIPVIWFTLLYGYCVVTDSGFH